MDALTADAEAEIDRADNEETPAVADSEIRKEVPQLVRGGVDRKRRHEARMKARKARYTYENPS